MKTKPKPLTDRLPYLDITSSMYCCVNDIDRKLLREAKVEELRMQARKNKLYRVRISRGYVLTTNPERYNEYNEKES